MTPKDQSRHSTHRLLLQALRPNARNPPEVQAPSPDTLQTILELSLPLLLFRRYIVRRRRIPFSFSSEDHHSQTLNDLEAFTERIDAQAAQAAERQVGDFGIPRRKPNCMDGEGCGGGNV